MSPYLTDPAARRAHEAYFATVERMLAPLGAEGRELRADLEAHVAEAVAEGDPALGEGVRLEQALARLGRPEEYLHALLADQYLADGTASYNPATITRGLAHALRAGAGQVGSAFAFALGYALIAIFAAMALLKPVWGEHVGLLRYPDGSMTFGIASDATGAEELLGWWTVPLGLALAGLLYIVLTRALRRSRRRR